MLIILAVPLAWAAASSPELSDAHETHVHISNFAFSPASVTVAAGDAVVWHNHDSAPHTATADDNSFDSGVLNQGGSWSRVFETPGSYSYYCAVHPSMRGTVHVEPARAPPTLAFTDPAPGAIVAGPIAVEGVAAGDGIPIVRVEVAIGSGPFEPAFGEEEWSSMLETRRYENGPIDVHARAFDGRLWSDVVTLSLTIDNPLLPDLVILDVTATPTNALHQRYRIEALIANHGTARASAVPVAFTYAHDAGDRGIAMSMITLGAGETGTLAVTWDTLGKFGTFDIHAHADPENDLEEWSKDGNRASTRASILAPGPSLDVFDP